MIQQGMNISTRFARRYHWLSDGVRDFTCETHAAICCDQEGDALNMVARESEAARQASTTLSQESPDRLLAELKKWQHLELPAHHEVRLSEVHSDRLRTILVKTYETQPQDFEALLSLQGVGPKTMRALSLIAELVHGAAPSFRDPVRYSFAHGGKDGHPYPVDRANYDRSIHTLEQALRRARLGDREKLAALRRLASWGGETRPGPSASTERRWESVNDARTT